MPDYLQIFKRISEGAYKLGAGGADSLTSVLQNAGLSGSDALYDADPDGDGLINLVEYALNLNPLQSDRQLLDSINDSSGLPIPTIVEGSNGRMLAIEYMRRKERMRLLINQNLGIT